MCQMGQHFSVEPDQPGPILKTSAKLTASVENTDNKRTTSLVKWKDKRLSNKKGSGFRLFQKFSN